MAKRSSPDPDHPSVCRVSRFPEDDGIRDFLRAKIHSRPKRGEAVWEMPDGTLIGHRGAVQMAWETYQALKAREGKVS